MTKLPRAYVEQAQHNGHVDRPPPDWNTPLDPPGLPNRAELGLLVLALVVATGIAGLGFWKLGELLGLG